jgi:hypothetical protein
MPVSPARLPAGPLVGGGGRDAALAAMAAVGIQPGSADEGSPLGPGRGRGSPAFRSSGGPPLARPHARGPAREGGGRDAGFGGDRRR